MNPRLQPGWILSPTIVLALGCVADAASDLGAVGDGGGTHSGSASTPMSAAGSEESGETTASVDPGTSSTAADSSGSDGGASQLCGGDLSHYAPATCPIGDALVLPSEGCYAPCTGPDDPCAVGECTEVQVLPCLCPAGMEGCCGCVDTAWVCYDAPAEVLGPWPDSSMCLGLVDDFFCGEGIGATDWSELPEYRWFGGTFSTTEADVMRDDVPLFTVGGSGFLPWGLAVAPDGDIFLGAEAHTDLWFGAEYVPMSGYSRFVARVSPEGEVRWLKRLEGSYGEHVLVAPQSDGSVILVSDQYVDLEIDGVMLTGTTTAFPRVFAARFAVDGVLAWATTLPSGEGSIEFLAESVRSGPAGEIVIQGPFRGTLALGDTELSVPLSGGLVNDAVITLTADGVWQSIAAP